MTPPPMTTISARLGSSLAVVISSPVTFGTSISALRELDELGQLRTSEGLDGPVVLLETPCPEVEVEVARRIRDRGPQGPPVLGHQSEQAGPGDLVDQPPAVVAGDELLELLAGEVAFAPDVAELEAGVVVARVLVVDQVNPLTAVDEIP